MSKSATAPGQPGGPLPRTDAPHPPVDVPSVTAASDAPAPKVVSLKIQAHPRNFGIGENARGLYRLTAPAGTTVEHVLAPIYWAHLAKTLRIGDLIEVLAEDGTFFLFLLVRDVQETAATVTLLQRHDLEAIDTSANPDDFRYEYSEALKWSVHRKVGNTRVGKNFKSEKEAREWARENGGKV